MADDNDLNDEMLDASESTDSDELGETTGDDGYDAPEGWSAASRTGTTEAEEREGESLSDKLAEERSDEPLADAPERPVADTPLDELDSRVDDVVVADEPIDGEDIAQD